MVDKLCLLLILIFQLQLNLLNFIIKLCQLYLSTITRPFLMPLPLLPNFQILFQLQQQLLLLIFTQMTHKLFMIDILCSFIDSGQCSGLNFFSRSSFYFILILTVCPSLGFGLGYVELVIKEDEILILFFWFWFVLGFWLFSGDCACLL